MQATQRRFEPSVIQRLLDEAYRFQFVQAMRVLLVWMRQNNVPCDQALSDVLRFPNSVSLNFPASQVEALTIKALGTPCKAEELQAMLQQQPLPQIRLTQAFMGFLGVNGGLPYHYSERIAAHQWRIKNDGARAFFDTFSGRLVPMFYQAWAKYRLEHLLDVQGKDGLLPLLLALGGVKDNTFAPRRDGRDHGGVGPEVAGYYAALLRQRPVSARVVERVLSDYCKVPIEVEQFVGGWDYIADSKVSKLGGPNPRLGFGATLGVRTWKNNLRVRLRIGPLGKADLEHFLPGASGVRAIEKLLGMFGLIGVEFEALLIVKAACIEPVVLSVSKPGGNKRLGWETFLVSRPVTADRADIRYLLHPC